MTQHLLQRPRRNRKMPALRRLVRESTLCVSDLVMPLFVIEGTNQRLEVKSMPRIYRLSSDLIVDECRELHALGIPAVALFPALDDSLKTKTANEALNEDGLYQKTIRLIKAHVPDLVVISDVALDPYSSDGHDGIVNEDGTIDNDKTLPILASMAVSHAQAGADLVAPSDMMDGRVYCLRQELDKQGFSETGILSYSAKYASSYYGPFRDALDSAPKAGDKKTYQMDHANIKEALREVSLDINEGADIVMVKPGLPYLDVVHALSQEVTIPVAVYNVSGEYAMLCAAASQGWLDYESVVMETLHSFKRAGASIIFTYHAREVAQWLRSSPDAH